MQKGCGQILLYEGTTSISKIIKDLTRSKFSHAALLYPCGTVVLESADGIGVRERFLNEDTDPFTRFDVPLLGPDGWQKAIAHGKTLIGTKYAWQTDVAFVLTQIPPALDERMCSQLAHECVWVGGVQLLNTEDWKVAPGHLAWSPLVVEGTP